MIRAEWRMWAANEPGEYSGSDMPLGQIEIAIRGPRRETPEDMGGGGDAADIDQPHTHRWDTLPRRVTPDDFGGIDEPRMVTTFSLRASDGVIRWTTDSHRAARRARLGSDTGWADLSGSVNDETWILSTGNPPLWRRLSEGARQAAIIGGGENYTQWTGALHRVLSDGTIVTADLDTSLQATFSIPDGGVYPPPEVTYVNPRLHVRRVSPDGEVLWDAMLNAVDNWTGPSGGSPDDYAVFAADISETGSVWLTVARAGPNGRWVLVDDPMPLWSFLWIENSTVRAGTCSAEGIANAVTPAAGITSAIPFSSSIPDQTVILPPASPPAGDYLDTEVGRGYYWEHSSVLHPNGRAITAWPQTPGFWSACSAGRQWVGIGDDVISSERWFTVDPSDGGAIVRRDSDGAVVWRISRDDDGASDALERGASALAISGNDLYAVALTGLSNNLEDIGVYRIAADTGEIEASLTLEDRNVWQVKTCVAWGGGCAFIWNNKPRDSGATFDSPARERYRYTRAAEASGLYVCDRDLTTATFVDLPAAGHRVFVVAESDDACILVIGDSSQLIGIDVTDPLAPVVVWRRVALLAIRSVQADGGNVTFGIERVPEERLGVATTEIPDWSDHSAADNSCVLGWENYTLSGDPVQYRVLQNNCAPGYEPDVPTEYLGDIIQTTCRLM